MVFPERGRPYMLLDTKNFIKYYSLLDTESGKDLLACSATLLEQVRNIYKPLEAITNPTSWRISSILTEEGGLRKPTIWLDHNINQVGHLSVFWMPQHVFEREKGQNPQQGAEFSDFINWKQKSVLAVDQHHNKILYAPLFSKLVGIPLKFKVKNGHYNSRESSEAKAAHHFFQLYSDILNHLNSFCEVSSNLDISYDPAVGIITTTPDEIRESQATQLEFQRELWRRTQFEYGLGVNAEIAIWANLYFNGNIIDVAHFLSAVSTKRHNIGPVRVGKLINILINDHLNFYRESVKSYSEPQFSDMVQSNLTPALAKSLAARNPENAISRGEKPKSTLLKRGRSKKVILTKAETKKAFQAWKNKNFNEGFGITYNKAMELYENNNSNVIKTAQDLSKISKYKEKTALNKLIILLLQNKRHISDLAKFDK
jgi:hypothetical protein